MVFRLMPSITLRKKDDINECLVAAIDDHPQHIHGYVHLGIQVFVMDQPWNRTEIPSSVVRVSGWDALRQWMSVREIKGWPARITESPRPFKLLSALKFQHSFLPV